MKRILFALAVCASSAAVPLHAAITTSISSSTGTVFGVDNIATFEPTGEDMAGMQVTVTFADGFTETQSWMAGPVGSKSGSASGTTAAHGWSLAEQPGMTLAGDTFGGKWSLTVSQQNTSLAPLTEVRLFGTPGHTVFDLKDPNEAPLTPGMGTLAFTPGSERGWTFELFNDSIFSAVNLTVHASYEHAVQVASNPVERDVYTTLLLKFSGDTPNRGLDKGYTLVFFQDTDLAVIPPNHPVPEPSSLVVFAGLAAIGGWRVRRRQKQN